MFRLILLISFYCLTFLSSAQNHFNLNDNNVDSGQVYTTDRFLFKYSSCTIQSNEEAFLDSLVTFLNVNPTIGLVISRKEIVISQKSARYSQCRADAIKQYLIMKGVEEKRLQSKGYTKKNENIDKRNIVFVTEFKTFKVG